MPNKPYPQKFNIKINITKNKNSLSKNIKQMGKYPLFENKDKSSIQQNNYFPIEYNETVNPVLNYRQKILEIMEKIKLILILMIKILKKEIKYLRNHFPEIQKKLQKINLKKRQKQKNQNQKAIQKTKPKTKQRWNQIAFQI